jgi:SAM-dependent methyltransferase
MASVLAEATTPYGAGEAFFFDTVIAPAIGALRARSLDAHVAELPRGARVLEVGSGGGQMALEVARARPDLEWIGVDLSPAQVARATRRTRAARPARPPRFVCGSALELPFEAGEFDAVVSVGSIKHWPDPARGLAECVRVLRPGGQLFVVEVDRGCRWDDARAFVAGWRMPRPLRPLGLVVFRTWVAGQAIDLDDARALLAGTPLVDARVERIAGAPGLLLRGRVAV